MDFTVWFHILHVGQKTAFSLRLFLWYKNRSLTQDNTQDTLAVYRCEISSISDGLKLSITHSSLWKSLNKLYTFASLLIHSARTHQQQTEARRETFFAL